MIKHLDINVQGRVQGVFFRNSTKAVADQLGVKGYITNSDNGDVFIEAEADGVTMEMFLEWCHDGPEHAKVDKVTTTEGELKNYRNFDVLKRSPPR